MRKAQIFFLFLTITASLFAQLYQGPAAGSITGGVTVNTGTFADAPVIDPKPIAIRNKINPDIEEMFWANGGKGDPKSIYFEDPNLNGLRGDTSVPVVLQSFRGIPETNSIPADPYIAAGPNHIIATVNTSFAIWTKDGRFIKQIRAADFFSPVLFGASPFDPKVSYDHFTNRWVMVWLDQDDASRAGWYLIAVSDDSDPNGSWNLWAMSSKLNGTTNSDSWGDYQGVGFDQSAIYLTSQQFVFNSGALYIKLRIIPKAQLLGATPGAVNWFDIWNFKYPHLTTTTIFGTIRPSICYEAVTEYPLIHAPSGGANFYTLLKVANPTTSPTVTLSNITVTSYSSAGNANQLGGGSMLIEGGGSSIRFEPTVKNGKMWAVHSINNPAAFGYSALHYTKIDITSSSLLEEMIYGASGFWHFYSGIAVDQDDNVGIVFNRSGTTEYVGAYFTSRLANAAPGFSGSFPIQTGKGNYVKDFGSGRNRWGDYSGIWLDPVTKTNFFAFSMYAAATNTWGTWVNEFRLKPYQGPKSVALTKSLEFGDVEVTFKGDTITAYLANYGNATWTITSFPMNVGPFKIVSTHSFPINVAPYDSTNIQITFEPTVAGFFTDTLKFVSNETSPATIELKGRGFQINKAKDNTFYISTGGGGFGNLYTINDTSGASTLLGFSNYSEVTSLVIHPKTKWLYGIKNGTPSTILRVNAVEGDAYPLRNFDLAGINTAAFDTSGTLYVAKQNGTFYTVDIETGAVTYVDSIKAQINAIAFNPLDNQMWASGYKAIGSGKDKILKVNKLNGDTTTVGLTGLNVAINDIEFNERGELYGVKGSTSVSNDLIRIDTSNAAGSVVGSMGVSHVLSLAYNIKSPLVNVDDEIVSSPDDYVLYQNYPNPFNPSTTISFQIPVDSYVSLKIYDVLGNEVVTLIDNEWMQSGVHNSQLSPNAAGFNYQMPSGIYFYELRAGEFKAAKKLILLK